MISKPRRNFRLFVLRWHRRIGLVLCVAIVWIATTGILLNHMHDWKLADKLIENSWVRQQYALNPPTYYQLSDSFNVAQAASGELFVNEQPVAVCNGAVQGVEELANFVAIACSQELLLVSTDGVLIETVSPSQGLPTPVIAIGAYRGRLLLQADVLYEFDDNALLFAQASGLAFSSNQPAIMPKAVHERLKDQLQAKPVSWERVLIDMHTGAFWGSNKTLISDIAAVLMMLIAIGGCWVWFTKPGRFRK